MLIPFFPLCGCHWSCTITQNKRVLAWYQRALLDFSLSVFYTPNSVTSYKLLLFSVICFFTCEVTIKALLSVKCLDSEHYLRSDEGDMHQDLIKILKGRGYSI